MTPNIHHIEKLPVHLILCTERTGSSLLNAILNQSPEILANSEELFVLYLYPKYAGKTKYTEKEIKELVHDFIWSSEKNLKMFFSDPDIFEQNLMKFKDHLPYQTLIRLIYWHFLDLKDKSQLKVIIDKQIKFLYYIEDVLKIFPDSKYLILTRDVRDNVLIRKKRNLHLASDVIYLAGIWNDTYKNVKYLFEKISPDRIKVIHYENLITQTEQTVREVCEFFEVSYFKEMLNYQDNYKKYLEIKRSIVGEAYYQRTLDFQSSLLKPISKDKINLWKKELTTEQLQKIATICGTTARYLNYDLYEHGTKKLHLLDKWQLFKANIHRYQFLKLYLKLPLWLKIWIKKIRGKRTVW
ncbi:MAG: hypothetical protein KatS3mg028_0764 [Bacteroidia bacterium]|nr:MAG: hypothetical protein KatS3mg028_0764 [Bacteroidia bacterium]